MGKSKKMDANNDKYCFDYLPARDISSGLRVFLWSVIKRNPVMWSLFAISDVIHHVRYPISFLLVGSLIDVLWTADPENGVPGKIWGYTAAIFLVLVIGELVHAVMAYFLTRWYGWMRPQIRADLLNYTLQHSYQYLQDHFAGALTRKITEASESTLKLNESFRYLIFAPLISMTFTMISVAFIHPLYGAVVFAFILSISLPVLWSLKKLHKRSKNYSIARADITGHVVDSLTNAISIKNFSSVDFEMRRHNQSSRPEIKAWMKLSRSMVQIENYRRLALTMFGGGMAVFCVYGWQQGIVTAGDMAAIMGMTFALTGAVWSLGNGLVQTVDHLGYISDALGIISVPHGVTDRDDKNILQVNSAEIRFENVRFHFASLPVFDNLNLSVSPGQHIGLIGPSGAGKSTLINLLLRYFDPQTGKILINRQNIADVTQNSLRANIAVIPQDTSLFHRTLMENIRYGRLDASDSEVMDAAQKAHAHEFISQLSDGYETLVGERGIKLSGGQRQRIAIARAILKNAPILILDEATSALDSESEKLIQESLSELMNGKTVIAIAHRLSTIAYLDRLIVMDQGKIIEDGSHNDLLKENGLYAKLWNMQSGGFLVE